MRLNFSINSKLKILVAIGVVCTLFYASQKIYGDYIHYKNVSATELGAQGIKLTSSLIHEVQVERGLSAGFLMSKGASNGDKLKVQREKVDKRLTEYKVFFKESQTLGSGKELSSKLEQTRREIDSLTLTPTQSSGFFTSLIAELTDHILLNIKDVSEPSIKNDLQAYSHLVSAKESLGQIRANLNAVFIADKFTEGGFRS